MVFHFIGNACGGGGGDSFFCLSLFFIPFNFSKTSFLLKLIKATYFFLFLKKKKNLVN